MIVVWLAFRDLLRDRKSIVALALSLAAALTPVLILMALKTGITQALLGEMLHNPANLQVEFRSDRTISLEDFAAIQAFPQTGFAIAAPRAGGSTVELESLEEEGGAAAVSLLPSGAGDPLLAGVAVPRAGDIVLSRRTADELRATAGDRVLLILVNSSTGAEITIEVTLAGITALIGNRFALVGSDLAFLAEAVKEGRATSTDDPESRAENRPWDVSRLRLYARDLDSVAALSEQVRALGYDIASKEDDIRRLTTLRGNLDLIFALIAGFATLGFAVALSISLWVNVERKRRSLAMLRLMGMRAGEVVLFPLVQAVFVAVIGVGIAMACFLVARAGLNAHFAGSLPAGAKVAALPGRELALLLGTILGLAIAAGAASGLAVIRMQPKEAMRDA